MKKNYILEAVKKSNKKGVCLRELSELNKNVEKTQINKIISDLLETGKIIKIKSRFFTPKNLGFFNAEIVKDCNNFLIARNLHGLSEFLVDKKLAKGALFGDLVICSKVENKIEKKMKEAKVEKIYEETSENFIGVIIIKNGRFLIKPDSFSKNLFKIKKTDEKNLKCYDKVVAKIIRRSNRYDDNICSIVANCDSSKKAINCANSIIKLNKISSEFSTEVLKYAKELKKNKTYGKDENRTNLTKKLIFTIDGKTAKDLDDAISIEKFKDHYILGVHIADVSHFVKFKDKLDLEAFNRANSIYYANKVIPMLPEILSNELCSLEPNKEKLTFSVFLKVNFKGKLLKCSFKKTIIASKIKGVYEEINDVFKKDEKSKHYKKYRFILPALNIMKELYQILKQNKIKRGCPEIKTKESIIVLNKHNQTVSIKEKKPYIAEEMIEEFMILANSAVANFAKKNKIPFLYRVHKAPKYEKILSLKKLMENLNIPNKKLKSKISPKVLSSILKKYKNTKLFSILNINILRSMEKAQYCAKSDIHFGLVLKNYAHFTSPIRRYSDLMVHRILKDYIFNKKNSKTLKQIYHKEVKKAAKQTSKLERKSMLIERSCANCFKAEYMQSKIGKTLKGEISSIIDRGIFVTLKNTIEGFISLKDLDESFQFNKNLQLQSERLNKKYVIGQPIKIICSNVNVSLGKISFKPCE